MDDCVVGSLYGLLCVIGSTSWALKCLFSYIQQSDVEV